MKKLIIVILFAQTAFAAKNDKAQHLDFDAMDVNSAKGAPGGSYVTSKKETDFKYFFETKIDFRKKILDSFETVR